MTSFADRMADVDARLAACDAAMAEAHAAGDATRWLAAYHAREDAQVARFLAEYPPCPADPDEPAEDMGPAAEWPAGEWDDGRWEPGPEPGPAPGPTPAGLDLPGALRAIAAGYRAVPSSLGGLLAEAIEDVLVEVEVTAARTVDQFTARRAALVAAYAPRDGALGWVDPDDYRSPCGVLAGHPDRQEGPPPEATP